MRSSLLLVTFALLGCVPLPHAKLVVVGQGTREVMTGPVVCGPIGFRKVPLQARWGEYVRVTVAAPSLITGTVLVHANGVAYEPRSWSTEAGALIVDARFPNEDPDARFALERERPIDLTLTGLSAPNGGTCEGAVFTVEQGALVPSVDERAWIAELERRGGPELAARRERARVEAEARRQAHYAAWEARQELEVSVAVVAQAEVIRQAHYAQWEARQVSAAGDFGGAAVAIEGGGAVAGSSTNVGGAVAGSSTNVGGVVGGGSIAGTNVGGVVGGGAIAASSMNVDGVAYGGAVAGTNVGGVACGGAIAGSSTNVGGVAVGGGVAGTNVGGVVCGGAIAGSSTNVGGVVVGGAVAGSSTNAGGAVAGAVADGAVATADDPFTGTHAVVPGSAGFEASVSASSSTTTAEFVAFPSAPLQQATTVTTVGATGEWSQPSDTLLRAPAQVSVTQPSAVQVEAGAQVQAGWAQPYAPRLEAVAVSTESQVATSAQYEAHLESQVVTSAPPPSPCQRCGGPGAQVVLDGAALFNFMLQVGAAAAQAPAPVHAAQPLSR